MSIIPHWGAEFWTLRFAQVWAGGSPVCPAARSTATFLRDGSALFPPPAAALLPLLSVKYRFHRV